MSQCNYAALCMNCSWLAYLCAALRYVAQVSPKGDKGGSFPSSIILLHSEEVG